MRRPRLPVPHLPTPFAGRDWLGNLRSQLPGASVSCPSLLPMAFPRVQATSRRLLQAQQPCIQAAWRGLSMRHPPGCSGQAAYPAGPRSSSGQAWSWTLATPTGAARLNTKVLLLFLYFYFLCVCVCPSNLHPDFV